MNLLPKDHSEFVKPEYWEKFFKKRGAKAFEWYGEYPELCGVLHKYIKAQDNLLMVGCGNSQLSADLYDVGHHRIVNIDISDTVIRQMLDKNQQQRPEMKFLKMDVLNMEFSVSEFSVVLDKGTLDALMVDTSEKVVADVEQMFDEIDRVLKPMGRYICISLLQEHILAKVLQVFSEKGWAVRIHKIHTDTSENSNKEFQMPVFALVFTKFKKNPNMPQVLEVCSVEEKIERLSSVEAVSGAVKEMQYYAIVRQRIGTRKTTEEQLSLSLYLDKVTTPRYTLTIVDSQDRMASKFAIFIVPQGRETEWMFSTDAGRRQLSGSAGFERLVVVALDRNHSYTDLDTIQGELSTKVMELAPPGFKPGTKVPFLSIGNDIGKRTVLTSGHSVMSGDYVIEDVEDEHHNTYRRLIFLANRNIVQSEARLKTVKAGKRGKGKRTLVSKVDESYLACQHHFAMTTGLALVQTDNLTDKMNTEGGLSVLLIGLGGGGLPTYIHHMLPKVNIDVVDIDPSIVTIATEFFHFKPDDRLRVHVQDGLTYILEENKKGIHRHVIMFDVDSKDPSLGLSCPPKPFVEEQFLATVKQSLHPGGVFVLNLVCRDQDLKSQVIDRVKRVFATVYLQQIEDEVNEILFALNCDKDTAKEIVDVGIQSAKHMNRCLKASGAASSEDFIEQMKNLKIL